MRTDFRAGEDRKALLSEAKRELLGLWLRGRKSDGVSEIPPRPKAENPLSFGQERIWFQCRVASNPAMYHIPLLARLDGVLDVGALESSLNEVIRRHEVLRSSFIENMGAPTQIIAPSVELKIARIDIGNIAPEAQEREVRRRAEAEALLPFDLAEPPLLRATLLELGPRRRVLLMTLHHIIWDGWSSGLLIKEISRLYAEMSAGLPSSLDPLPIQYCDFAHWHRRLLESDQGRRQIEYWKTRLAGLPELSALRSDRPRPAMQLHHGGSHSWRMPDRLCGELADLAREQGVTLFVVLLATFKVLLFHYCGQADIAIGTIVASRTRKELEHLLGFFANALVLRTQDQDDPSFRLLLSRVHEAAIDAQANQDAPFERLVEELGKKRTLGYNPLFQSAFVLHNLPSEKLDLPGLSIRVEETSTQSAAFDVVLHVFDERPGLRMKFEYDSALFEHSTIVRMATHFSALAQNAVTRPDSRLSTLSLLDAESASKVVESSYTRMAFDTSGKLLHQLVGAFAPPNAQAVVSDASSISYDELMARARQLAHRLVGLGVGPDTLVGVLVEPSVDMVVAMLGILEANGAYLPLDPSYPSARLEHMLTDSKAIAIVTTRSGARALPKIPIASVCLDEDALSLEANPTSPLPVRARADNLAYVIYTSGSTGVPKGVMVSHGAAVASTLARRQYYSAPVSAYLLLSSIAFDSSVAGVFWTLCDGGRLCIPSERTRRDPAALVRMIERQSISHLLCLPSLYSEISRLASPVACKTLECVIVAGEECRAEVAERHFERLPHVALFNEYGPTECTVWNTVAEISKDASRKPIGIGRPAPGAKALVLGLRGALLPEGVSGELCAGGAGIARGYLGRPDLTAERFLPNPFGGAGERLYRTGDHVRRRGDGALEFLGRIDNQVKVRGHRIEPAEIEKVLLGHRSVVEGVVVASFDENGVTKLAAFVVPLESDVDVKSFLAERLPSYMVPETIIVRESLPKLPNGKIDRSALRIGSDARHREHSAVAPAAGLTMVIAEIWRDVLGVAAVGENDDFFELGGNSLSAIQVIARVQQLLGGEISVAAIFDHGRLGEFTREVESAIVGGADVDGLSELLADVERSQETHSIRDSGTDVSESHGAEGAYNG